MVDEILTALEGEPPMLREVQDDGSTVDAEADVFDRVSVGLCGRCYWNRFLEDESADVASVSVLWEQSTTKVDGS